MKWRTLCFSLPLVFLLLRFSCVLFIVRCLLFVVRSCCPFTRCCFFCCNFVCLFAGVENSWGKKRGQQGYFSMVCSACVYVCVYRVPLWLCISRFVCVLVVMSLSCCFDCVVAQSDAWFDDYMYQIVLNTKSLPTEVADVFKQTPVCPSFVVAVGYFKLSLFVVCCGSVVSLTLSFRLNTCNWARLACHRGIRSAAWHASIARPSATTSTITINTSTDTLTTMTMMMG